jgi:putative endonuclease
MGSVVAAVRQFFQGLLSGGSPSGRAAVGRRGEVEAVRLLKRKGYEIVERNYRVTRGEVDVIAFRDGVLAFVEVRSRTEPAQIAPVRTVTPRKQARIIRAARTYATLNGPLPDDCHMRFDIVSVLFPGGGGRPAVEHIEDAFHEGARGFG